MKTELLIALIVAVCVLLIVVFIFLRKRARPYSQEEAQAAIDALLAAAGRMRSRRHSPLGDAIIAARACDPGGSPELFFCAALIKMSADGLVRIEREPAKEAGAPGDWVIALPRQLSSRFSDTDAEKIVYDLLMRVHRDSESDPEWYEARLGDLRALMARQVDGKLGRPVIDVFRSFDPRFAEDVSGQIRALTQWRADYAAVNGVTGSDKLVALAAENRLTPGDMFAFIYTNAHSGKGAADNSLLEVLWDATRGVVSTAILENRAAWARMDAEVEEALRRERQEAWGDSGYEHSWDGGSGSRSSGSRSSGGSSRSSSGGFGGGRSGGGGSTRGSGGGRHR